jgi:cytochrome c oxidase accessory protein FixG
MTLDAQPMSVRKAGIKVTKHGAWIALALWTGITFVGYFTPIRDLVASVGAGQLGGWAGFWVLFYGFATYGNAGWMREQVCKYMCPYARFQSAMFDKDTMIVTYDAGRGEPRGARSKKADYRAQGLGSCVDCTMCVQVCPTGIDIRNGLQYECIGCAACIDACDQVMGKMGYPQGLIRYTTENALAKGWHLPEIVRRIFRPRIFIYTGILFLVTGAVAASLVARVPLKVDVLRDRGTMTREVEGGGLENVYRLQIMNTQEQPRRYRIAVAGLPTARIAGESEIELPPATTRQFPVRVQIDAGAVPAGSHKFIIEVDAVDDPSISAREKSVFLVR